MALKPLSLRAYAAHRKSLGLHGGSLQAVQRAIAADRIRDAIVTVAGVKKVADPELADREWSANTDPSKSPLDLDEDRDESPIILATAREKHFKANLAELQYLERAGELVDAAEVRANFVDLCTSARNKLLGLPSRMKQAHPELSLAHLATLDVYIRESLEELAADEAAE